MNAGRGDGVGVFVTGLGSLEASGSGSALASVLETLRASDPRGRRVLVTGDMLELGPLEVALHREVGRLAGASSIGMVIAVGIMAFILIVGGAFGIVLGTGSVDRALERLLSGPVRETCSGRILKRL